MRYGKLIDWLAELTAEHSGIPMFTYALRLFLWTAKAHSVGSPSADYDSDDQ